MLSRRSGAAAALRLGLVLLAACATYTPAPVDPTRRLAGYTARQLDDPGFARWLDSLGLDAARPLPAIRRLALAAQYFLPTRDRWAAEIRAADAATVTAGAPPAVGAEAGIERVFLNQEGRSPWGGELAALFTTELGGKRGARIARARAGVPAARAGAAAEARAQVAGVYAAALEVRRRELLARALVEEDSAMSRVLTLARARHEDGVTGRLELARVEGNRRAVSLARESAEREALIARQALTAAAGVPPAALMPQVMPPSPSPGCLLAGAPRDSLLRSALAESWALRHAVAAYQVAEGDVRVEVAQAAPDLSLRPGLSFDQGSGKFGIGFGLPSLPRRRNRGPIAEAEARRSVAAAEVDEVQETVLATVDGALASCQAAGVALAAADSQTASALSRADLARQAFERGEAGRLEVALADLETVRGGRGQAEALGRWEAAGSALELALGAWGRLADGPWPAVPGVDPQAER